MGNRCDLKNNNYNKVNNNFFLSVSQWSVLALLPQGVSVLGGRSPGGKCLGGICPWGKCPGGTCPGGGGGLCPRIT